MKKNSLIMILLMVLILILNGCGGEGKKASPSEPKGKPVQINISAAASLTDALTEIQKEYAKKSDNVLQFNFAASGALQKQIEEGAPCDLFISAAKSNMDTLEQEGLILSDTRRDLLGNKLTLIAASEKADKIKGYEDLLTAADSISIGTPESVPAGKYAQQALQKLGLWDRLQKKLVYAKDVRQVLEYVDTGNVDCGIVYQSDTLTMKTGVVVANLPEDSHDPIIYPAALIKDSAQSGAAADFYDFLQTDYAKGVFEKYGFTVL